eukprot:11461605-Karenia_brevis.AAC.1
MQNESPPLDVISFSAAISVCEKGGQRQHVAPQFGETLQRCIQICKWQCGYAGIRVGEAGHPGPICPDCESNCAATRSRPAFACNWCGEGAGRGGWIYTCSQCTVELCGTCAGVFDETMEARSRGAGSQDTLPPFAESLPYAPTQQDGDIPMPGAMTPEAEPAQPQEANQDGTPDAVAVEDCGRPLLAPCAC